MLEYALKQERWVPYHPLLLQPTHSTHIPQQVSNKCSVFRFYNKKFKKKFLPQTVLRGTVAVSDSRWSTKHHVGFVDKDSNRCVSTICRVACSATELNWCLKSSGLSLPPQISLYFLCPSLMSQLVSAEAECRRDSPESSWCYVSSWEQVLAWTLCMLSDAHGCTVPSRTTELEGERSPLSTKGEVTVGTFFLRRKGDALVVVVTTLCISISLWSMAAHWNRDVSDVYTSLLKCL